MVPKKKADHLERITAFFGKLVVDNPVKIMLIFTFLTILLAIPIPNMDTSTSMSDFMPESEFIDADLILREKFNTSERIIGILDAGEGSVLSKDGLIQLRNIEERIRKDGSINPYLVDHQDPIVSIYDPVKIALDENTNRSLKIEEVPKEIIEGILDEISDDPDYSRLVSQSGRYASIIFTLRYDMMERGDESVEVELKESIESMDLYGFEYYSFSALNDTMRENAVSSLKILLPISFLVVIVILALSLRSVPRVIIALLGIVVALVMSFGLFSLMGLLFSQMMFFAPIVVIVLCIDYGIHILFRDREFERTGEPPSLSMKNAVRFMGVSIGLSTITTAFAFGSNGLSRIPAVSAFGVFLAMGIIFSFLVMIFFVPALVLLYKKFRPDRFGPGSTVKGRVPKIVRKISDFLVSLFWKAPYIFIAIAIILAGTGAYYGLQIEKDMAPDDVTADDSSIVKSAKVLREHFPDLGREFCHVIIHGDIENPGVIDAVNRSIQEMSDDHHVADVDDGVISIIPMVKELFLKSGYPDNDGNDLPDSKEVLTSIFDMLYEKGMNGSIPLDHVKSYLSRSGPGDYDALNIMVAAVDVSGPKGGELLSELKADMDSLDPYEVEIEYAGFVFERYDMLSQMISGMTLSTVITMALVTLLVIFLFRSFRYGIITSSPIILVIGWIMGVMTLGSYKWNMVTVIITSMTVGVGIDYSIHLVERYRQEIRNSDHIKDAMSSAIATTGGSLFAAAATTFGGFFVMTFSKIGMYESFGMLTSLMILFAMVSSVFVLPPIILLIDRLIVDDKDE